MQLTVREAAQAFGVSEKILYQWIEDKSLPAYRINDQYRFNRTELMEWAQSHHLAFHPESAADPAERPPSGVSLLEALEAGGITPGIQAADKTAALRAALDALHLPPETDRAFLLNILLAREALASTGIGDGIAIPHVRSPLVLPVVRPIVGLALLAHPIPFEAIDGKPVHALFTLICPTIRSHLALLGRLAFLLRDPTLHQLIERQAPAPTLMAEIRRLESPIESRAGSPP